MDKKQKIIEILENMSIAELVEIHNRYCEECNYPDDTIYRMDDYEELMQGTDILRLTNMICYGSFSPNDDYWWFDGNGNLQSSDYPGESNGIIYISDIANAMLSDESGYGNDDIQEIIDEEDDDE